MGGTLPAPGGWSSSRDVFLEASAGEAQRASGARLFTELLETRTTELRGVESVFMNTLIGERHLG